MSCDRTEVQYYLDGELQSPELEALEAHLAVCVDCRSCYEQELALQKLLSDAKPLHTASPQLRANVEAIIRGSTARPTPAALRQRVERSLNPRIDRKLLFTAALLIAVAVLWQLRQPASVPEFVRMAVDTHQRRLRGQLPLEVASSSPLEVSRWFDGKVGFRLELPKYPENRDYRLEGARLVSLGRDYGAYIGYRAGTRPVTLVVASSSAASATGGEEIMLGRLRFHCTTVDGFKVIAWVDHGLTYALVSDLEGRGERSCAVCHADSDRLYRPLASLNP